jgi:hypothetical protein
MIVYDICCEKCGMKVGEISYPSEPDQKKLDRARSGYVCETCSEEPS